VAAATAGRISAIATGPIHKEAFHLAGVPYPGHTELLAALTKTTKVCMMMASDEMIVSLVTAHLPHAQVAKALTEQRVLDVIDLTADALKKIGRTNPHITVCGLNPHAGEAGLLGSEEKRIIAPAIAKAKARGIRVVGPLPADTAFVASKRCSVDAYVAMYHDQGLIPFKMLAFETGVNITLGLPIVRTSVDHGTAFDIAWKGIASADSLVQSILWAKRLARAR
jgi:4-hydroxythreonine-4-phosphate dehydrogenase